jgi:hypothetical protein
MQYLGICLEKLRTSIQLFGGTNASLLRVED